MRRVLFCWFCFVLFLPGGLSARLSVSPTSAPAKSDQVVVFTWTVDAEGLDPGGGFQVEFSSKGGTNPFWKKNQTDRPNKPGYTTAWTDGPASVELIVLEDAREVTVQVAEGRLEEGDRLFLQYEGFVPQIVMEFPWHARERQSGQEDWQLVSPERSAVFRVTPAEPEVGLAVIPSDVQRGEAFDLAVVVTDRYLNRTGFRGRISFASTDPEAVLPEPYRFRASDRGVRVFRNVRLHSEGFQKITVSVDGTEISVDTNYARVWPFEPPVRRFYGETHCHTGTGQLQKGFEGRSGDHRGNYVRAEDAYAFARDVMRLDFAATSEHDRPTMTDEGWVRSQEVTAGFHDPPRFVTFFAWEWTAGVKADGGGQRVVLYDRPGNELFRVNEDGSRNVFDLWASLEEQGAPALTIPHVQLNDPENTTFQNWHPVFQPIGELYSKWSETGKRTTQVFEVGKDNVWTYQHAWSKGFRMGVIGSTDNHFGQPGLNNYSLYTGHHGGLAVALARENRRESLWEAFTARRTYATTGRRIYLDFLVKGRHPMGSGIEHDPAAGGPWAEVRVAGTAPLQTVEIVKYDGESYRSVALPDDDPDPELFHWRGHDPGYTGDSFYYVRVTQTDGEMAWSSPVWIDRVSAGPVSDQEGAAAGEALFRWREGGAVGQPLGGSWREEVAHPHDHPHRDHGPESCEAEE